MNFYQRASLSLTLAVILGLEFAILNLVRNGDGPGELWGHFRPVSFWLAFQILFRAKVVIDDHVFFESDEFKGSNSRFFHFLFLMVSVLLFAIAASTSFAFEISAGFFLIGLILSTLWVVFDLAGSKGSGDKLPSWLIFNVIYILVLSVSLCKDFPGWAGRNEYNIVGFILLGVLVFDAWFSETLENAPEAL